MIASFSRLRLYLSALALAAAVFLSLHLLPRTAVAQTANVALESREAHAARDMVTTSTDGTPLAAPPLPAHYRQAIRGPLRIAYDPRIESAIQLTLNSVLQDATSLADQLGMTSLPPVEIRLVPDEQTLRELAPLNAPPPRYAVGVAYPSIRLTLVSMREPQTAALADVRRVLRHELSHLLLALATNDAPIPRWFSEGLAVTQAAEHSFERFEQLMLASWTRSLIPIATLNQSFSASADIVDLAYAQSADFVAYLLQRDGLARLSVFCEHLRRGVGFEAAIQATWSVSLRSAELAWKDDVAGRHMLLPFLAGAGLMWGLASLLLVLGWWRSRLRAKRTLKRWALQEAEQDERYRQAQLALAMSADAADRSMLN
jgi:hypothetical protein